MTPRFKVIDNYLPEEDFKIIQGIFYEDIIGFPWYFGNKVNDNQLVTSRDHYFHHTVYHRTVNSEYYNSVLPLLQSFDDLRALIRVKMNCYPSNDNLTEHAMHVDYTFPHQAAVFSINNCDGYTKFHDGTIVESVANRIVFFDGSLPHCSTNCTDVTARFNINFNYL